MSQYIIANLDRLEYLRPQAFGEPGDLKSIIYSYEGCMLGLTVLLSDSNGRGGGDLHSDDEEYVGRWAGERILIVDELVEHDGFGVLPAPGALQQHILANGTDVSQPVIDVIVAAEGRYNALAQMNMNMVLSRVQQRELPAAGRGLLCTEEGRNTPLEYIEQFFGVLGVEAGLTERRALRQLQRGCDKMAAAFPGALRPEIVKVTYVQGMKDVHWRDRLMSVPGTVKVVIGMVQKPAAGDDTLMPVPCAFTVHLGANGTTTAELYDALFGITQFDKQLALTGSADNKEV